MSALLPSARGAANARNIGATLFKLLYGPQILGGDHVPRRGRVILAANHTGFLDGPLLVSASPRPVHVMTKQEMFEPPLDKLLNSAGQIPLDYESADRPAIGRALEVLRDGRAVGIFPEAHRGRGDVSRIRHGVAYLQTRTQAPIVPVAILGTRNAGMSKDGWPALRSEMAVVYGEPFVAPVTGDLDQRATLSAVGEVIRQRLADHVRAAISQTGIELPGDDVTPPARNSGV